MYIIIQKTIIYKLKTAEEQNAKIHRDRRPYGIKRSF